MVVIIKLDNWIYLSSLYEVHKSRNCSVSAVKNRCMSFQSHRSVNVVSRSKMALPVQTNMKHFFSFIPKFNCPKRLFCAGACPENKVRAAVKMCFNCGVLCVGSKKRLQPESMWTIRLKVDSRFIFTQCAHLFSHQRLTLPQFPGSCVKNS